MNRVQFTGRVDYAGKMLQTSLVIKGQAADLQKIMEFFTTHKFPRFESFHILDMNYALIKITKPQDKTNDLDNTYQKRIFTVRFKRMQELEKFARKGNDVKEKHGNPFKYLSDMFSKLFKKIRRKRGNKYVLHHK
ncbi:hypothetical protein RF11_02065 [Thelohanellus kitauei]|uniref:Uncharacterized protein n=1 Tax=Thelohanellus kitauei TaxID=669202 RepID=A0A0C2MGX6_THEKT|nr:hypothetical protein RF11_02065 [Thelohanellus kitauei]